MPSGFDLKGKKFGRLLVLRETAREDVYLCRCSCGIAIELFRDQLTRSVVRNCGCTRVRGNRGHGHTRSYVARNGKRRSRYSGEWLSWKNMKERCYLPTSTAYESYGGRGITVCSRWLGNSKRGSGFANFLADMGPRPTGTTLDRINVNGNYEPSNCRWADAETQANNKQRNVPGYVDPSLVEGAF